MNSPEILGPDFCPFHTALSTGKAEQQHAALGRQPLLPRARRAGRRERACRPKHLIVTVRDVTREMLQQQKLAAIHQAGVELADMKPDELAHMTVDERIELLKSNILHYTKDLLQFDVVEIRLLDHKTGKLEPLLAVGMSCEAAGRVLRAEPQNNGVTGFVAATGKSYLCEDTTEDPLYLEGCKGAKSSLTVPLILHDEVIGTFNVESPEPHAFTESDLQFLEIFTRDVAVAINTLELLVAEKANAMVEGVEAIHSAVALPVDEILNEAVNVMERYIGHEPEVVERLQKILRNARDIKQVIQKVGQKMAPAQALPATKQVEKRPVLRGKRRAGGRCRRSRPHRRAQLAWSATAASSKRPTTAAKRSTWSATCRREDGYDAIIADIRLPDMSGYEFLAQAQEMLDSVPLILMTGYGYDPGHTIVKCSQAGLPKNSVLCKPFRLDQLVSVVEQT